VSCSVFLNIKNVKSMCLLNIFSTVFNICHLMRYINEGTYFVVVVVVRLLLFPLSALQLFVCFGQLNDPFIFLPTLAGFFQL
jgi:hypothetical protein